MSKRIIDGHVVRDEPCDGLAGYTRVFADGRLCGLVHHDDANQWHTLPAAKIGEPAPPMCYAPTCELALSTLVAEAFR